MCTIVEYDVNTSSYIACKQIILTNLCLLQDYLKIFPVALFAAMHCGPFVVWVLQQLHFSKLSWQEFLNCLLPLWLSLASEHIVTEVRDTRMLVCFLVLLRTRPPVEKEGKSMKILIYKIL